MLNNLESLERAKTLMPGGVNSPVRAFKQVDGTPPCMIRSQGAYLYDVEGKRYVDFIQSWGALIFGHGFKPVTEALTEQVQRGISFGASSKLELDFALELTKAMPNLEKIRLVNSGTEATMTAIRLARGYTKRDYILKFNGHYHGHADHLLVKAGSGLLTCGIPACAGVPEATASHTLTINFNDLEALETVFRQYGERLAAVILEPIAGNMNLVLPVPGFLESLRKLCDEYQSVLIFDEVMTGFRVAYEGAQGFYGIRPDLTCLGKVIGGGLPLAAFGGRAEIMDHLAPMGPVYQAGTLAGNQLAVTAGLVTLRHLSPDVYTELEKRNAQLISGLESLTQLGGLPFKGLYIGGMFGIFFLTEAAYANQTNEINIPVFKKFFHGMLERGVYFAPSAFEAGFVSSPHDEALIGHVLEIAEQVLKKL
ncbi:MAG: glutamate-1-semialdehyde 2,1-aminomutase [Gammaproteobacteria bacterium]